MSLLAAIAFASTTQVLLGSAQAGAPPSCPSSPQLSCHNSSSVQNTCCFNSPGGQLLQTQFWDTDPATGPATSWTVHGLWPDHCDGTFDQFCDASREYTNITQILQSYDDTDLLSYMNTYWKDENGNDESFWEHEWGKHGTCISTLEPSCYTGYTPQEEVSDFFKRTVDLFKTLPSYDWLSQAGITPSSSKSYDTDDVQTALSQKHGAPVTIQCTDDGALDEIWYHFNVKGSVQDGQFVAAPPDGSKSSCSGSIKYLPKSGGGSSPPGPTTTTTTSGGPVPTSPGSPFGGSGTLQVSSGGKQNGCIISGGTWYTTGTCASFKTTSSDGGFTLTSSKGPCAVTGGSLTCGSGVQAGTFSAQGSKLAYDGSAVFSAAKVPTGSDQEIVAAGSGAVNIEISWMGK